MRSGLRKKEKASPPKKPRYLTALVANAQGEIFDLAGYAATGITGRVLTPLTTNHAITMPHGGELMYLPDRYPVLYNLQNNKFEVLAENPYAPGEPLYPVAAFNSPGYVNTQVSAYEEAPTAGFLPLFAYGAVGWHRQKFYSAVMLVDGEKRQDLRQMPQAKVVAGVKKMRKKLPDNRLRAHLENCALNYGCPAGKNFFLGRYEAPLPTAQKCNARCLGCLSLQSSGDIPCSQERINFTPSAAEISDVALTHIGRVTKAVVSFGQGCEGDPLTAAKVIAPAIKKIRRATEAGTINLNTNGGLPDVLAQLFDAGLDSVRVSLNSVREDCYNAYFRPAGYSFSDVLKSIDTAIQKGKFVAINYLNMPGFSDSFEEAAALESFLKAHSINMIQWRNLNFDPHRYFEHMQNAAPCSTPLGMPKLLAHIRKIAPNLKHGYFNPPKEKF